jgi:pimeloyl-ACP methyl ester carboxylesterase
MGDKGLGFMNRRKLILAVGIATLAGVCLAAGDQNYSSAAPPASIPTFSTANIAREGFFFVGGHYVGGPGNHVVQGSMYVEVMVPKRVRHPYPVVFFPQGAITAIEFMQTPDGRPGWARWFVDQGYVVYVNDPPTLGRSPYVPNVDGPKEPTIRTAEGAEKDWTASQELGDWPQAKKYSAWPGSGLMGDPAFDNFMNYLLARLPRGEYSESLRGAAGAALLDKIGPAVLIGHAEGAGTAWMMADARPKLVRGIITLQPQGPPMEDYFPPPKKPNHLWGLTYSPIHYDPPIKDPSELQIVKQEKPEAPDLAPCWRQKEPARKLVNLVGIPELVISTEAGYHRLFDHCTAEWLNQAGVKTDFVGLETVGIHGNGDEMVLEKNSFDLAKFVDGWIEKNVH